MNTPIPRRKALKTLATGAAAIGVGLSSTASAQFKIKKLGLQGNIQHSVCRWCYKGMPLEELCMAASNIGLVGIDLVGIKDFPTLKRHGLIATMVDSKIPGSIPKGMNRLEHHDALFTYFEKTIPIVAEHGYKNMICFSGNRDGMSDSEGMDHCAKGLARIMPLAEKHNIMISMELLNSKHDHEDYMCDHTDWGVNLVEKVASDNFRLLYDIYHMQIMEGDIIDTIRNNHKYFSHYHTGGVPGRHEINDTQELNYPAIMKAILETGYTGIVAQEFLPTWKDPIKALANGVKICDV